MFVILENKFISNIDRAVVDPKKKQERVAWCTTVNRAQKPACIMQTDIVQENAEESTWTYPRSNNMTNLCKPINIECRKE